MHGLGGRMEQFQPLGEHLTKFGVVTTAWNLRGQGLDPVPSRRGKRLDADRMIADLAKFVEFTRTRYSDASILLTGDSMGAQLALVALADSEMANHFSGSLLFVPVTALRQRTPAWIQSNLRWIGRLFPTLRLSPKWFVSRGKNAISLSRVPERQRELDAAPYRLREFSLRFLSDMGLLIDRAAKTGQDVKLPIAVFTAGVDLFLTEKQNIEFFRTLASSDRTYFHYPEAHHDLLHDSDQAKVFADVTGWLQERNFAPSDRDQANIS